jgi:hypothetical protein
MPRDKYINLVTKSWPYKFTICMVCSNRTLPYHYYLITNATKPRFGYVPTIPNPRYRFVGQFANTDHTAPTKTLGVFWLNHRLPPFTPPSSLSLMPGFCRWKDILPLLARTQVPRFWKSWMSNSAPWLIRSISMSGNRIQVCGLQ